MKTKRKAMFTCQNCIQGNNEKGKHLTLIRKLSMNKNKRTYIWNIFCEKKKKYMRWFRHKRCFEKPKWMNIKL